MSPSILALMTVPIAVLAATCAVAIDYRSSKILRRSVLTVVLKCCIGISIAIFLQMLDLLLLLSLNQGLTEAKETAATIAAMPIHTLLFLSRWDMLRLLPIGAIVTLTSSGKLTRYRKILHTIIASVISIGVIKVLFAKQIYFSEHPSALFLVVACILEGSILAIILERIRLPKAKLIAPTRLLPFVALLRVHLVKSAIVVGCGSLIVLYLVPRDSRIFLKLSKWREITIEYTDVPVVRRSKLVSLLFTLFDSWPVAGGEDIQWVSFKSPRKMLYFSFLAHRDDTSSESTIDLAVSRVDNYPPVNDLFLFRDLFKKLRFNPQIVFREKITPGTFTIEAPEFACAVYTPHGRSEKNNEYNISAPLRTGFTLSRENKPTELFAPMLKEISPPRDWISISISDKTLGFSFSGTAELMMFCTASRGSLKKDVQNIRISGKGLAKPVVIGPRKDISKSQPDVTFPGFLIELRNPNSRVTLGIPEGARHIGLGTSNLNFIGGNISTVGIKEPSGTMKIDADDVKQLDLMDELSFLGNNLQIATRPGEEITIYGQSRNITLNGVSLAKPLLPEGLTKLIGQVVDVVK